MAFVLDLLEQAAVDKNVLSIKVTLYRVAKDSRVVSALLNVAVQGKHISVLFEIKARFVMENLKIYMKLLLIVSKEANNYIFRYAHFIMGDYNEKISQLYNDIRVLTSSEIYANDISEFFNVITGHSIRSSYQRLIVSSGHMCDQLC